MARSPRLALFTVLLATACAGPTGPGPQHADFPAGQRTTRSGALALELTAADYTLREIEIAVRLTNEGDAPLAVEHEGVLLAYNELEFPVVEGQGAEPAEITTTLGPGDIAALQLRFVIEQPLFEAATLQLMSIRRGDDQWLEPLRIPVPPPMAYVEAADWPEGKKP